MAGGGGGADSPSILETPSYVLALVLIFFLVVSMSFDHGVAALRRRLQRKGRQGLAQALDKIVTEVTLLGFVSLILMLFQDSLAKICVGYSDTAIKFTMLEHIDGECPCCLANTHGVTKCAQLWETCPFNSTTDAPFCGCDTGSEYPVPNAECGPYQGDTSICTGPYVQGTCSEGHMPAISVTALNQLHLQIFLVAVFHGLCAVYVALGGFVRIKQWTRWQDGLLDQPEAEMHIESSAGEMPDVPQGTEATEQQQQQQLGAQAATEVKAEERDSEERENDVENGSQNGVASQKSGPGDDPAAYVVDTITNATKQAKKTWGRRRTFIVRRRDWLSEALVCLGKALLPNLVSRTEFEMMYAGYCKSHGISGPFDFVGECRQQLDFDMGSLVGFSLEMWLVWVLVVLLSGLASAFLGYLLLFGVVCLFFSNIVLVAMVRFACRGGRPNELETTRRWYKNPGLLAIPLRLEIFTCSLAFSTTIFFSWQFGANSCLFKEGVWPYVVGGLWWWTAIVISILMLSWTALVTIPAWTLCVHMSPKSTTQPILEGGEAPPEQNWTSEKLVHEIARLQTLQRRERNAMSFKRS